MDGGIDPPSCFDIVEPSNDDLEILEELHGIVLHRLSAVGDVDARASVHNKFSCHLCLVLVHIFHSE